MSTCIAVIDDDPACRELLHDLLREEGYAVHPFPHSATPPRCLLLPVTGPLRGLRFIVEQVKEQVDAELDPRRRAEQVQAELIRLSVRRDRGQISEDEYAAQEAALLEQLNALRAEIRGDTEDIGGS